ncbi:MAG: hypothetical protein EOO41_03390 [Methanobacteriota archaeon]|nr:MAG: hypothetical protein EOO41_03390 [Euryarchaeota archaeon]
MQEVAALALIALVSGGLFFSALARVAARKSMVLSAAKNAGPYTDVEGNNFSAALNTTVFFAGLYFVHAYLLPNVVYNLEVAHLMHPLMDASASMILPAALTYVQAASRKYLF